MFTGLIWAEIKQLWDSGLKEYLQDMWNILDFTTNSFYISTFTLRLVAYLRVSRGTVPSGGNIACSVSNYSTGLVVIRYISPLLSIQHSVQGFAPNRLI